MCISYWPYGSDECSDDVADINNEDGPLVPCQQEGWWRPSNPHSIRAMLEIGVLAEMHRLLETARGDVGKRLRVLWEKHENKLNVFATDSNNPRCEVGVDHEGRAVVGVYINIERGAQDGHVTVSNQLERPRVLKPYQTIFHEFFHFSGKSLRNG